MARFAGEVRETFSLPVPAETAAAHFADLETIAANYVGLERHEILGDGHIRFVLEAQSDKGITYQGRYDCRYTLDTPTRLTWATTSNDNMWSTGHATFRDAGDGCRVDYYQKIESEIPVPRLLAKVVKPIVNRKIAEGVREYIGRMKAALPRG